MSINLEQFNEQVKPVREAYNAKLAELTALQDQFENLVNAIVPESKLPDDYDAEGADEQEEKYYDEIAEIGDVVGDLAYDFGLEWSGSFEEGGNDFWTPSSC